MRISRFSARRRALSDLMATVLLVAVTLIAGAALFGYVNGMATNSENAVGNSNAANVNFLNERFVVVDMNFSVSTPSTSVSIWLYNNGVEVLNVTRIEVYNSTRSMDIVYQHDPTSVTCTLQSLPKYTLPPPQSNPVKITLALPPSCGPSSSFSSGKTYYVNVLGVYGNTVVSSACFSSVGKCAS